MTRTFARAVLAAVVLTATGSTAAFADPPPSAVAHPVVRVPEPSFVSALADSGTVLVAANGNLLRVYRLGDDGTWAQIAHFGHGGTGVAIAGNGREVAATPLGEPDAVELYRKTAAGSWVADGGLPTDSASVGDGRQLALSADGSRLLVGLDAEVRLYARAGAGQWSPVRSFPAVTGALALSRDGTTVATAGTAGVIRYRVGNAWAAERITTIAATAVALSTNGETVAWGAGSVAHVASDTGHGLVRTGTFSPHTTNGQLDANGPVLTLSGSGGTLLVDDPWFRDPNHPAPWGPTGLAYRYVWNGHAWQWGGGIANPGDPQGVQPTLVGFTAAGDRAAFAEYREESGFTFGFDVVVYDVG